MRLFSLLRKKSTAFILFLTSFVMDAWDWIRGSKLYDIRILTLSFMWNMGEQIYKKIYIFPAPWNKTIKHVWKNLHHWHWCKSIHSLLLKTLPLLYEHIQEPYLSSHCIGIHKKCTSPIYNKMISTLVSFDRQDVSFLCM